MSTPPSYAVTTDPARDLIRIRVAGFFTPDKAAGLIAARDAAHARLNCGPNQHVTIADLRDMPVQAQDIMARFGQLMANPAHRSRRVAVVTGSALARLQAQRTVGERAVRYFEDMAEAEAWALSPD